MSWKPALALGALAALSLLSDVFIHPHAPVEGVSGFGFYAGLGFGAAVALIAAARALSIFIRRKGGYYESD